MGYPRARGLQRVLTKEVEDHMHREVSLIAEHARRQDSPQSLARFPYDAFHNADSFSRAFLASWPTEKAALEHEVFQFAFARYFGLPQPSL